MLLWISEKWSTITSFVLNVNAEHWAALAALLSAVVASIQMTIGFSQKEIQRRQERLSLFERRYDLFRRKNKCIYNVFHNTKMLHENSAEIRNIVFETKFLFGERFHDKSSSYFNEIITINYEICNLPREENEVSGRMWTQKIEVNARPEMTATNKNEKMYFDKLDEISLKLDEIFEPYLTISRKDF